MATKTAKIYIKDNNGTLNQIMPILGTTSIGDNSTPVFLNGGTITQCTNVASDSAVVHLTGNETISGNKSFTSSVDIKISALDKTDTTTTTEQESGVFRALDKNDSLFLQLNAERRPSLGYDELRFRQVGASGKWADFRTRLTDDDKFYMYLSGKSGVTLDIPVTDNGTTIPTTAWVRTATGNFACNAASATTATLANSSKTIAYTATHTASESNTRPYHLVAYTGEITSTYQNRAITLLINRDVDGKGYGIFRVILRVNGASSDSTCSAQWLVRTSDIPVNIFQVGFNKTPGKTYVDLYIKETGTYTTNQIRVLANYASSSESFTFTPDTRETNSTTYTDYIYETITEAATTLHNQDYSDIITPVDSGVVDSANSAVQDENGRNIASTYMWRNSYERIAGSSSAHKNLNSYTTAGFYNVATQYVDNVPTGIGGYATLLVYPWKTSSGDYGTKYVSQEITEGYSSTNCRRWIRKQNNGTWSSWYQIALITDTVASANTLGSSTVGSETTPIYLDAGVPTASSTTIGASNKPVFLSTGVITACTSPLDMNISGTASYATTATKLGTANVGTGNKPMYLASGTPTAFSTSIGSASNPIYMSSGVITASGTTIGATNKPIFMNSGTFTALSGTIGSHSEPVYINGGVLTKCTSVVNTVNDQTIAGIKTYDKGPFGKTTAMSASAIDLSTGVVFTKTITANTTFTITNCPSSVAATFNLILTNGGSKTITWPSSVKWANNTAPDLTASGVDVLTFVTPNGGTTWYGTLAVTGA